MIPAAPSISVVICAYTEDRWDDLVAGVESMRIQTHRPDRVVLVIDHNPTLLDRARAAFTDCHVIPNAETRGLSGGRNTGTAASTGDVVAFIDDDAYAEPEWLERLAARYTDEDVLAVGGGIVALWETGRPTWWPEEFDWVVGCSYRGLPRRAALTRNLIGCNMSFRRDVLLAIGGFSSELGRVGTLPVGCEETELCIRAKQQYPPGRLVYEPSARVHHRVPGIRARWSYFRDRCHAEGRSKAIVARLVGAGDGLSTERTYTMRTLPRGVFAGIGDTVRRRDPSGLTRAGAIVAGLGITTAGYVKGRIRGRSTVTPR